MGRWFLAAAAIVLLGGSVVLTIAVLELPSVTLAPDVLPHLDKLAGKPGETAAIYQELIYFRSLRGYLSILFPVALLMFVTLGAALGTFFVTTKVTEEGEKLKNALTEDLKSSVEAASREAAAEATASATAKMHRSLSNVEYGVAALAWSQSQYDRALLHIDRAIDHLGRVLDQASDGPESLDIKGIRDYFECDKCYFLAERYRETRDIASGAEAIGIARRIPELAERLDSRAERIALFDNFLFVIVATEHLGDHRAEDLKQWRKVFNGNAEAIRNHLSEIDRSKLFDEYQAFSDRIGRDETEPEDPQ